MGKCKEREPEICIGSYCIGIYRKKSTKSASNWIMYIFLLLVIALGVFLLINFAPEIMNFFGNLFAGKSSRRGNKNRNKDSKGNRRDKNKNKNTDSDDDDEVKSSNSGKSGSKKKRKDKENKSESSANPTDNEIASKTSSKQNKTDKLKSEKPASSDDEDGNG
ncbi:putative uncharacterized transmembrane protein DDB_G0288661 [Macrosteles quadrilineatus]|uniref:putative uncharacterized transmembrane protein DDB_G0288661 n=1 Tax=Macrosteles quadrilineatus TaxID=74068 RepID=UPI0023E3076B|nr:putative uncharacterized transmembrane protein DDB_G0288661 [Macrosteles quadrilineatus]